MAQYFEVVGQINSQQVNDNIQYVITQQEISPQTFRPPQQIVVSNNQLMVVNQTPKQVIIDKTRQVAFQAQPEEFVLQENVNFQATGQQQICYMDGSTNEQIEQVVVEHPVVIKTQTNNLPPKILQQQQQQQVVQTASLRTVRVPQQLANSRATVVVGQSPNRMILNRVQQQPRQQIQLNLQPRTPGSPAKVQRPPNSEQTTCDGVTLPNGTIISLAEYRKMQQQTKLQNSVVKSPPTPRLPNVNNLNKAVKNQQTPFSNQQPRFPLQQQRLAQQQRLQQQKLQQQKQQKSQSNYIIQPRNNQKPKQQRPLASFIPSSQIQQIIENTPMSEEYSDSIRMLVLLANGEQRLITFTLPKEACTIQEILEQVNVPFQADTKIQVTEANSNGINYVVTVGNVPNINFDDEVDEHMECEDNLPQSTPQRSPTPEPPKHVPKIIPGQLAVCGICGYLSEDFSRCLRCKRNLPDDVKAVPSLNNKRFDAKLQNAQMRKKKLPDTSDEDDSDKKMIKSKLFETETVVLSSDDENDEEIKQSKMLNAQILEKLGNSITISPISKEPSLRDIQQHKIKVFPPQMDAKQVTTSLECRTIRIGSYRFVPPEKVYFDLNGLMIKVVPLTGDKEMIPIRIERGNIVKVLASFDNTMPVIFYYLTVSLSETIRKVLGMTKNSEYYFDPLDKQECNRRITLLPEEISDEVREILQQIYSQPVNLLDELTTKEANEILIKICPKDLHKTPIMSYGKIKELLVYPPEGRVRIAINTEDYICLGTDQFLNDVIIDFYLKFIVDNLPEEQREKVHVFSTFFYKRLTTKPYKATKKSHPIELDPNLSAAEKRHARVKTWTKNIDLFEKDFIIVPINENAHWFLAIICYPNMTGCVTMDGGEPYKLEVKTPVKKKVVKKTTVGNVTIVQTEKSEKAIICDDSELSDKDEAEGDDSELDSDDSEASSSQNTPAEVIPKVKTVRPAIKQPCILIFDSLLGASRSRVVATLRDYLTCEYKAKLKTGRIYNKDNIKGACPKVPQQTNFTDCGLYLLQYVEQFFKDPIKDYYIPIAGLKNWFDEMTVTKKREDISILIKDLMKEYNRDLSLVPEVAFPTLNGKLVEHEEAEEEEDMFEDIGVCMHENDEDTVENELSTTEESPTKGKLLESPIKTSTKSDSKDFIEQKNVLLKPDICELPKTTTNRETLSYLKAKRIIRHKNNEGPDHKKVKSD